MKLALIIPASGFSRRFGQNKLCAAYMGKPLLQHALELGQAYPFYRRILVTPHDGAKLLGEKLGYTCLDNPAAHEGQSASLRIGVAACGDCGAYMFLPGDQPRVRAETLVKLACAMEGGEYDAACAVCGGERLTPTILSASYRAALLSLTGDRGGKSLLMGAKRVFEWEISAQEAFDIDYPKEILAFTEV